MSSGVRRGSNAASEEALEQRGAEIAGNGTPTDMVSPKDRIEELRQAYASDLLAELRKPNIMASLRGLLQHRDPKIRMQTWDFVFRHVMPTAAAEADAQGNGGIRINFLSHVPRPALAVEARSGEEDQPGGQEATSPNR